MIVLVGFMGAGKSSAARDIAADAGAEPLDADELVAERLGMPIPEFFARHGEEAFRRREEELVLELLRRDGAVLALGGGAVESPRVREALRAHRVVLLDVDAETAWSRVRHSDRPLARDRGAFAALHARRRPLYEEVADLVVPAVRGAALRAVAAVPEGARGVWARTAGGEYPVVVGRGVRHHAPEGGFVVTDSGVPRQWAPDPDHVLEAGERNKTLAAAEGLWRAMARAGVTRAGHVRAVGGGVVTDLAGFCAATYQRGVPVVHVPTTLLGMVDAAIGGKTGVDLPEAKNYVGAYHQPLAVLADLDTLSTLPPAQLAEGYAEVVKTALIAGGALWERVAGGADPDEAVIFACARTKVAVVEEDERDGGRRQVLNLGHTVAHAIETTTGYALTHGQAVGLGLLAALRLSGRQALRDDVAALLAAHGLPTRHEALDVDAVVAATRRDKKRTGEDVPFVLVAAPGDVRHGQAVEEADLRAAVEELRR
ncbi:MAG TPA: bifunctional shikimate kinase/3-dehydroquinate synthase [Solirubrobacteraceae bacterium]|nr:bifunctional shikimate kinase/3-dehydroquinate synthase [Solirubrobacteraceae bacterium]